MEVTRDNFAAALPKVEEALQKCLFYAIDLEMSGIMLPGNKLFSTDTLEERYLKNKRTAQKFLPVQFGLCTFELSDSGEEVIARSFSFYIYPSIAAPAERRVFSCSSNTLSFLLRHQFNLYKWVNSGIPFDRLNAKPEVPFKPYAKPDIAMDTNNASFMTLLREKLHSLLTDPTAVTLKIKTGSSLERRLVYQETAKIFGGNININSLNSEMHISKQAPSAAAGSEAKGVSQDDRLNFAALMKILIGCKKPVIGHNCYMDLCFTLHHLANGLPPTLEEFKKEVMENFPLIIDTKHIANFHPEFKSMRFKSALDKLVTLFEATPSANPFNLDNDEAAKDENEQLFHNAGYDAFCTGKILLYMLARMQGADLASQDLRHRLDLDRLKEHHNKIFNMASELDTINLNGIDDEPVVKCEKFLISGFSKNIAPHDLKALFQNSPVQVHRVYYVDESRSWVEFSPPAAIPLCANVELNKEQTAAFFSKVPTGNVSDLLEKGLLTKPSDEVSALLTGAKITSWKEWYQSTIHKQSSDESSSECESSEASDAEGVLSVANPDELDIEEAIEDTTSSDTIAVPNGIVIEVAEDTREKKSRFFDSMESLPATKKARTESNL